MTSHEGNIVKFVRFRGYQADWERRKHGNVYKDSIVFAQVFNGDPIHSEKYIYAGKDVFENEYEYYIPDVSGLVQRIIKLENLVNIDSSKFTNEDFKQAIENVFIDSSAYKNIIYNISTIYDKLTWVVLDSDRD